MAATTAPRTSSVIVEHDKHHLTSTSSFEKEESEDGCCNELTTDGGEENCTSNSSEQSLAASTAYFCTITCPGRDQVLELLLLLANSDLTTMCAPSAAVVTGLVETECVVEADFTLTRVFGGAGTSAAAVSLSSDPLQLPACGYVVFCSRTSSSHALQKSHQAPLQAHIFSVAGAVAMPLDKHEWNQVFRVLKDILRRLTGFSVTNFCSANRKNDVLRSHRGFCFICLRLFTDLSRAVGHARYSHSTQLDETLLQQGPVLLLPGDETSGGGGGGGVVFQSSALSSIQILYLKPCYDAPTIRQSGSAEVTEEEPVDLGRANPVTVAASSVAVINTIDMNENTKLSITSDVAVDLSLRGGSTNGFYNNNNNSNCTSFIAAAPFCPKSIVASLPSHMEQSIQSAAAGFPPQLVLPPFLPLGSSSAAVAVQEMLKNLRGCVEHMSTGPVADCLTCRQLLISNLMSAGMPPQSQSSVAAAAAAAAVTSQAAIVPVSSPNSMAASHQQQQQQHGLASVVPRNSTKNLKCPKCNWHYKYAETLEIHLREKHPEQESEIGNGRSECIYCAQKLPHPRLTRGETYSCGFKPYRCDICNYSTTTKGNLAIHNQSDKHNNNLLEHERSLRMFGAPMTTLRQPSPPPPPTSSSSSTVTTTASVPCTSPAAAATVLNADSTPLSSLTSLDNSLNEQVTLMDGISSDMISSRREGKKTVYRCELCSYETNVYRNLKIHVTSEKHLTNQNMSFAVAGMSAYGLSPLNYHHSHLSTTEATSLPHLGVANLTTNDMALDNCYRNAAVAVATNDMNATAASLELEQHVAAAVLASGALDTVFQCNVCTLFATDDLDEMQRHCHQSRQQHDPGSVIALAGFWHCNLCDYKSNLKANFQLHCKTDKHLQRLSYRNHLREGGEANMIRFSPNTMTTVQIRCNACNFFATSLHKLQQHVALHAHEINAKLLRYLAVEEHRFNTCTTSLIYMCYLCAQQFGQKLDLMKHLQCIQHLNAQQTRQAQLQAQGQLLDVGHIVAIQAATPSDDLSIVASSSSLIVDTNATGERTAAAAVLSQVSSSDVLKVDKDASGATSSRQELGCVCCNMVSFQNNLDLERHLRLAHNIESSLLTSFVNAWKKQSSILVCVKEEEEKVEAKEEQSQASEQKETQQLCITMCSDEEQADVLLTFESVDDLSPPLDQDNVYPCHSCTRTFTTTDDLFVHLKVSACCLAAESIGISSGPGFLCWKKGCNQYFRKRAALERHFNEIHAKNLESALLSESESIAPNSVFRYRCSHCPLLFRCLKNFALHNESHQKIAQLHSCALCGKVFCSRQKLCHHLQLVHVTASPQTHINSYASNTKLKVWKCDLCGDDLPTQQLLQNHINSVHHEVRGDETAPKSPLTIAVCLSTVVTPTSYSSPLASLPVVNATPLLSMTSPFTAMAAAAAAGFPPPHGFSAHIAAGMLRLMSPQNLHSFPLSAVAPVAPQIVPSANLTHVSSAPTTTTNSFPTLSSQNARSGHGSNSRARTRIVGSKRKLLMDHFNLNNSPNDEEIEKLANETDLPPKVIKHWFRNTLFKERQKDNTCPYNFSVPPQMRLNLAEYERSGRVEVQPVGPDEPINEELATQKSSIVLKRRCRRSSSEDSNCSSKPPVLKIEVAEAALMPSVSNMTYSSSLNATQMVDENCSPPMAEATATTAVVLEREDSISDGFPAEDSCSGVSSPLTASEISEGEQSENVDIPPSSIALNSSLHQQQHDVEQYQHLLQQCYQQQYYLLQQQQQQQHQHNYASFNLPLNSNLSSSAAALTLYYQQQQQQACNPLSAAATTATWPPVALYDQLYAAQQSQSQLSTIGESGVELNPNAFSTLQRLASLQQQQQHHLHTSPASSPQPSLSNASSNHGMGSMTAACKRALPLSEDDVTSEDMNSEPANKRQRTNISYEQASVLFQEFSTDPNPSRRQTEAIATRVGLTKRVVQVWFQNQRARERRSSIPHSSNSTSSTMTRKMINLSDMSAARKCRLCGVGFRDVDMLRCHLRMQHPEYSVSMYSMEEQVDHTDGESESHDLQHLEAEIPRSCHSPRTPTNADDLYVDDYEDGDEDDAMVPPPLDLSVCGMEDENSVTTAATLLDVSGTGSSTSSMAGANKRNRTNITSVQLRMLQIVFAQHRMPSMAECETLGRELHLHRRVVQVWFQNNRAKEKKRARDRGLSNSAATAVSDNGGHLDERDLTPAGCKLCGLALPDGSARSHEHLCSSEHLRRLHERARLAEGLSGGSPATATEMSDASVQVAQPLQQLINSCSMQRELLTL